ncbi:MAG: hypothetical protein QM756_07425 [Polyangiaceae bacterium]
MPTTSFSPRCASCGQRAPIVFRGIETRCAACDALRSPITPSVSFAGQPSRVGGIAASLAGWAILVIGLSGSLGVLLLLQSIWPASMVGYAVGLPLGAVSLFFGMLLVFGGRSLRRRGVEKSLAVRREAMRALIAHRKGTLTSRDAAGALGIDEAEADALLTQLSRESTSSVRLDVDDDGTLRYDFNDVDQRFRVLEERENPRAAEQAPDAEPAARRSRA